jgi:hypothetical protein
MKRGLKVALLIAIVFGVASTSRAHHSFAATYNERERVTVEGALAQFAWRNPHSFVHVNVKDPATGQMVRWSAEWGGGGQLSRQGVARDSLRVGDQLVVSGDPSRTDGDHRLRVRTILRPADGWRWGGEFD